jgi:hypothetical protein
MTTQLMVQPSSFMPSGVSMSQLGEVYIFRFTDELQSRLEELLNKNKRDSLTQDERAELDRILALSRIFTLINAQLAAQAKWCPRKLEDLFDNALDSSVSNVIPPNT